MKLPERIKKIVLVSRPVSWVNTVYPFAAAYLVAGGQNIVFLLMGSFYFLIPYNILMYGLNDVFDYESDIKNPRKGGIEGMRESRSLHPSIIFAATITNLPFFLYFLFTVNKAAMILLCGVLFFVVAYSVAVLRFKERPGIDSATSSMHFVGPMIFGLLSAGWSAPYTPYVAAFFLWGMASHAFGAVQDIIPDRKGDIASIATKLGAKTTVRIALILYIAAIVLLATASPRALPVATAGLLYCLNIAPFLGITDENSAETNQGWRRFLWLNYLTGFVITLTLISLLFFG